MQPSATAAASGPNGEDGKDAPRPRKRRPRSESTHIVGRPVVTESPVTAWLKASGRSYTGLAKELGYRRTTVYAWTRGLRPIPHEVALAIRIMSAGAVGLEAWANRIEIHHGA